MTAVTSAFGQRTASFRASSSKSGRIGGSVPDARGPGARTTPMAIVSTLANQCTERISGLRDQESSKKEPSACIRSTADGEGCQGSVSEPTREVATGAAILVSVAKRYGQHCPVAKSLDQVGERWTLLIVRDLLRGPARFQDLRTQLSGIPPKLLADRLRRMERQGLVSRTLYSKHPPRASYALTDRGP